ncbi:hypothetical protein J4G37_24210 [Microvirga sp. 3-52]|nr:hypothetical protein [Microvirga sp. 3-52]
MTRGFSRRNTFLAMALLVFLPFSSAGGQEIDRLNEVNPGVEFSSVSRAYPDMNARYARVGAEHSIVQVRRIAIGQSQSDLQALLGRPATSYGDGSFEFHLSLPLTRRDRLICQYRVFFDGAGKVERAIWRRPQCAELVLGQLN